MSSSLSEVKSNRTSLVLGQNYVWITIITFFLIAKCYSNVRNQRTKAKKLVKMLATAGRYHCPVKGVLYQHGLKGHSVKRKPEI